MRKPVAFIPLVLIAFSLACIGGKVTNNAIANNALVQIIPENDVPGEDIDFIGRYPNAVRSDYYTSQTGNEWEVSVTHVIKNGNLNEIYKFYNDKITNAGFKVDSYNTEAGGSVSIPGVGEAKVKSTITVSYSKEGENEAEYIYLTLTDEEIMGTKFVEVTIDYTVYQFNETSSTTEENISTLGISDIVEIPEGFVKVSEATYDEGKVRVETWQRKGNYLNTLYELYSTLEGWTKYLENKQENEFSIIYYKGSTSLAIIAVFDESTDTTTLQFELQQE